MKFDLTKVHLRKSNTEPIIRIYAEVSSPEEAQDLADRFAARLSRHLEASPST